MDLKKVIEELKDAQLPYPSRDFDIARSLAIGVLEEQVKDRWIPVSEKLPPKNKPVLLFLKNKEREAQFTGYLYHSENKKLAQFNGEIALNYGDPMPEFVIKEYVIAWRPLPDPYKGEQE